MYKMRQFLWMFFICCSLVMFSGCESGQQKKEDKNAAGQDSEIAAQLLKEQNDLLAKANQEIHNINQKLILLNENIRLNQEKGRRMTKAQNDEIDQIEKLRATLNPRIHQIKQVSQAEWENFSTTFEKDIEEVKSRIDVLINELQMK